MDKIKVFDVLCNPLNIISGLLIGNLAATCSWWILLLGISQMFFMGFAVYFKNKLKEYEKLV